MFIIELTYKVSLDQIDQYLESHVEFLDEYFASGNFIASGRKVPRDGGIILAIPINRTEVEAIIKQDPFYQNQLADYKITEFVVSKKSQQLIESFS
ncbi:MAG: GTP cyclohydrolase [Chitinophagaceae bacterium]